MNKLPLIRQGQKIPKDKIIRLEGDIIATRNSDNSEIYFNHVNCNLKSEGQTFANLVGMKPNPREITMGTLNITPENNFIKFKIIGENGPRDYYTLKPPSPSHDYIYVVVKE